MSGWNFVVNTGDPSADYQTVEGYRQTYEAQGMTVQTYASPTGGTQVVITPASPPAADYGQAAYQAQQAYQQPAQQAYQQPAQQDQYYQQQAAAYQQQAAQPYQQQAAQPGGAYGAASNDAHAATQFADFSAQDVAASVGAPGGMQYAMAGGGAFAAPAPATAGAGVENQVAGLVGAPPIELERVKYLRKVYGLLGAATLLAVISGWAAVSLGPTYPMVSEEGVSVQVPMLTALMLGNEVLLYGAFGLLFLATVVAGWVSKVPYLNVVALMGVAILMGVEMAPMVFVAQFYAGLGETMSASPVRDAGFMVTSVFVGITAYIFITRKDFSYLYSILSMGVLVVFSACILAIFMNSEVFSLAVASVGALLAAGLLLYVTSYIFKHSEMDDPVGDALAMLVQLRNLFMFLLRIFMSRR